MLRESRDSNERKSSDDKSAYPQSSVLPREGASPSPLNRVAQGNVLSQNGANRSLSEVAQSPDRPVGTDIQFTTKSVDILSGIFLSLNSIVRSVDEITKDIPEEQGHSHSFFGMIKGKISGFFNSIKVAYRGIKFAVKVSNDFFDMLDEQLGSICSIERNGNFTLNQEYSATHEYSEGQDYKAARQISNVKTSAVNVLHALFPRLVELRNTFHSDIKRVSVFKLFKLSDILIDFLADVSPALNQTFGVLVNNLNSCDLKNCDSVESTVFSALISKVFIVKNISDSAVQAKNKHSWSVSKGISALMSIISNSDSYISGVKDDKVENNSGVFDNSEKNETEMKEYEEDKDEFLKQLNDKKWYVGSEKRDDNVETFFNGRVNFSDGLDFEQLAFVRMQTLDKSEFLLSGYNGVKNFSGTGKSVKMNIIKTYGGYIFDKSQQDGRVNIVDLKTGLENALEENLSVFGFYSARNLYNANITPNENELGFHLTKLLNGAFSIKTSVSSAISESLDEVLCNISEIWRGAGDYYSKSERTIDSIFNYVKDNVFGIKKVLEILGFIDPDGHISSGLLYDGNINADVNTPNEFNNIVMGTRNLSSNVKSILFDIVRITESIAEKINTNADGSITTESKFEFICEVAKILSHEFNQLMPHIKEGVSGLQKSLIPLSGKVISDKVIYDLRNLGSLFGLINDSIRNVDTKNFVSSVLNIVRKTVGMSIDIGRINSEEANSPLEGKLAGVVDVVLSGTTGISSDLCGLYGSLGINGAVITDDIDRVLSERMISDGDNYDKLSAIGGLLYNLRNILVSTSSISQGVKTILEEDHSTIQKKFVMLAKAGKTLFDSSSSIFDNLVGGKRQVNKFFGFRKLSVNLLKNLKMVDIDVNTVVDSSLGLYNRLIGLGPAIADIFSGESTFNGPSGNDSFDEAIGIVWSALKGGEDSQGIFAHIGSILSGLRIDIHGETPDEQKLPDRNLQPCEQELPEDSHLHHESSDELSTVLNSLAGIKSGLYNMFIHIAGSFREGYPNGENKIDITSVLRSDDSTTTDKLKNIISMVKIVLNAVLSCNSDIEGLLIRLEPLYNINKNEIEPRLPRGLSEITSAEDLNINAEDNSSYGKIKATVTAGSEFIEFLQHKLIRVDEGGLSELIMDLKSGIGKSIKLLGQLMSNEDGGMNIAAKEEIIKGLWSEFGRISSNAAEGLDVLGIPSEVHLEDPESLENKVKGIIENPLLPGAVKKIFFISVSISHILMSTRGLVNSVNEKFIHQVDEVVPLDTESTDAINGMFIELFNIFKTVISSTQNFVPDVTNIIENVDVFGSDIITDENKVDIMKKMNTLVGLSSNILNEVDLTNVNFHGFLRGMFKIRDIIPRMYRSIEETLKSSSGSDQPVPIETMLDALASKMLVYGASIIKNICGIFASLGILTEEEDMRREITPKFDMYISTHSDDVSGIKKISGSFANGIKILANQMAASENRVVEDSSFGGKIIIILNTVKGFCGAFGEFLANTREFAGPFKELLGDSFNIEAFINESLQLGEIAKMLIAPLENINCELLVNSVLGIKNEFENLVHIMDILSSEDKMLAPDGTILPEIGSPEYRIADSLHRLKYGEGAGKGKLFSYKIEFIVEEAWPIINSLSEKIQNLLSIDWTHLDASFGSGIVIDPSSKYGRLFEPLKISSTNTINIMQTLAEISRFMSGKILEVDVTAENSKQEKTKVVFMCIQHLFSEFPGIFENVFPIMGSVNEVFRIIKSEGPIEEKSSEHKSGELSPSLSMFGTTPDIGSRWDTLNYLNEEKSSEHKSGELSPSLSMFETTPDIGLPCDAFNYFNEEKSSEHKSGELSPGLPMRETTPDMGLPCDAFNYPFEGQLGGIIPEGLENKLRIYGGKISSVGGLLKKINADQLMPALWGTLDVLEGLWSTLQKCILDESGVSYLDIVKNAVIGNSLWDGIVRNFAKLNGVLLMFINTLKPILDGGLYEQISELYEGSIKQFGEADGGKYKEKFNAEINMITEIFIIIFNGLDRLYQDDLNYGIYHNVIGNTCGVLGNIRNCIIGYDSWLGFKAGYLRNIYSSVYGGLLGSDLKTRKTLEHTAYMLYKAEKPRTCECPTDIPEAEPMHPEGNLTFEYRLETIFDELIRTGVSADGDEDLKLLSSEDMAKETNLSLLKYIISKFGRSILNRVLH